MNRCISICITEHYKHPDTVYFQPLFTVDTLMNEYINVCYTFMKQIVFNTIFTVYVMDGVQVVRKGLTQTQRPRCHFLTLLFLLLPSRERVNLSISSPFLVCPARSARRTWKNTTPSQNYTHGTLLTVPPQIAPWTKKKRVRWGFSRVKLSNRSRGVPIRHVSSIDDKGKIKNQNTNRTQSKRRSFLKERHMSLRI